MLKRLFTKILGRNYWFFKKCLNYHLIIRFPNPDPSLQTLWRMNSRKMRFKWWSLVGKTYETSIFSSRQNRRAPLYKYSELLIYASIAWYPIEMLVQCFLLSHQLHDVVEQSIGKGRKCMDDDSTILTKAFWTVRAFLFATVVRSIGNFLERQINPLALPRCFLPQFSAQNVFLKPWSGSDWEKQL